LASLTQLAAQALDEPHAYGAQLTVAACVHMPEEQVPAPVSRSPEQLGAPQTVPLGQSAHAPAPLHVPD
jgi:hypothetical protein